jgi:hypothetical protein
MKFFFGEKIWDTIREVWREGEAQGRCNVIVVMSSTIYMVTSGLFKILGRLIGGQ